MGERTNIMITGVSSYLGGRIADKLIQLSGYNVIGLDGEKPRDEVEGLDFIQADIRNPLLAELLKTENIGVVCHLGFIESEHPSESTFDFNVMGTMKLFGACAEAGVQRILFKSHTWVYGALPDNSAFLAEDQSLRGSRVTGTGRDLLEIEGFCNGFRQQSPETTLTILRFAPIIGLNADTPMTRFLKDSYAPLLLGFDPMMQVIHEDDVVGAIVQVVHSVSDGTYNIAAEGVMPLTRLMGLVGKLPLPVPHFVPYCKSRWFGNLAATSHWPIEPDHLRYTCVADINKMRTELQFTPRYTAEEALREFAGIRRMSGYPTRSTSLSYDEERLRDTIERRRRDKERSMDEPMKSAEGG